MKELKQFTKFAAVGLLSTALNYGLFFYSYNLIRLDYIIASALGYIFGLIFGYLLNRNWTYQHRDKHSQTIYKYLTVYIGSLLLGLIALKILVNNYGFDANLANILVIGLSTITNFSGTKFWVFKQ
jgi:putative flippase GtrA